MNWWLFSVLLTLIAIFVIFVYPTYAVYRATKRYEEKLEAIPGQEQYQLGNSLLAEKKFKEAFKAFRLSAEQGDSDAQIYLGTIYSGDWGDPPEVFGIPKDMKEALKWFKLSAEQGDPFGQNNTGMTYFEGGQGVHKDYVKAYMWLDLAVSYGHSLAIENRDKVAKLMTNSQIAQAQKLAKEWIEKHQKE